MTAGLVSLRHVAETVEGLLAAGAEAASQGDWQGAREAFAAALEVDPLPEARFGLADALWWLGDLDECIDARQQAYVGFRDRSDPAMAVMSALLLSFDYRKQVGNVAAADGWLARAASLVDDHDLDDLRGWLCFAQAFDHEDPRVRERLAREAGEVARLTGDRELELCALSELGSALVRQGQVREGVTHLDEAMAASLGGEGTPEAVVVTSCNMMQSCAACAEFERVVQWVHATDRFMEQFACPFLYAECRVVFGAVLLATGDWERAERELQVAVSATRRSVPALHRQSVAMLAELRLAQGRVEEASRLLGELGDTAETATARAALALAEARPDAAAAIARRRLDAIGEDQFERAHLVELLGEAECILGAPDRAEVLARELVAVGTDRTYEVVRCRGERLLGRARAQAGEAEGAQRHLEHALTGFDSLDMAFDAARTRMLLARTLQTIAPALAADEARQALAAFEQIGARHEGDAAAAFLRGLGASPARRRPRTADSLTERENEVLTLLGEGLSNPEIAQRLFVSRKTVEHHVSRVLAKLGLRSRTEAATAAVRLGSGSAGGSGGK